MSTYHLCDTCDQPIDLCECNSCENCGNKIDGIFRFCSDDCESEFKGMVNDKIKNDSKELV